MPTPSRSVLVLALAVAAPTLAPALALPPEVPSLSFTGKTGVAWSDVAGATSYALYQGDAGSLAALGSGAVDSCRRTFGTQSSGPVLDEQPAPGAFQWFLVTAIDASGEGGAGSGAGGPRQVNAWGSCCGTFLADDFPGADGGAWPTPWSPVGGVDVASLQGGWARLRPTLSGYSLARMHAPGDGRDVEVTLSMRFEDVATQGIGFYVRQNGGYLQQSAPRGQGYAVFVEGFRGTPGIGLWKEQDGNEIALAITFDPALGLQNGVAYRVRFRVQQIDASTTQLSARLWPSGGTEPAGWQVQVSDQTPVLQGISGGVAVDSWSSRVWGAPTPAFTLVDDVRVSRLCNPFEGLAGTSAAMPREDGNRAPVRRRDVVSTGDGTTYFTDPPVSRVPAPGLAIPWTGIYRLGAGAAARPVWRGEASSTAPGGLALSPDHRVLYMTDALRGILEAREVLAGGTLGPARRVASGLARPKGACVDAVGNVLVVTDGAIEAVAPDGTRWGAIAAPRDATTCAFTGPDRRTLTVVSPGRSHGIPAIVPGAP